MAGGQPKCLSPRRSQGTVPIFVRRKWLSSRRAETRLLTPRVGRDENWPLRRGAVPLPGTAPVEVLPHWGSLMAAIADAKRHAARVVRSWAANIPTPRAPWTSTTPLELLVATILSAQCTDERVNMVTRRLFRKYPSAAHFAAAPAG